MKLRTLLAVASSILSLTLAQSARANSVTNGDFETGDFTGWTQFGNTGFTGVVAGDGFGPSFGAAFGPIGSTGGISQSIVTTPSQLYYVQFYLRNDGGTPNSFQVDFGANTMMSVTNLGASSWTIYGNTFAATGASTLLSFTFQQDPAYYHLDNVSVTAVGGNNVPDATSTLGLVFASLVGMVGLRRRFAA